MDLQKTIKNLCTPAFVYLVISTISFISLIIQNYQNTNTFCVGQFECNVQSTAMILAIQVVYVIFWTYILNLICTQNKTLSWFLVLFPFILFFIGIGLLILNQTI